MFSIANLHKGAAAISAGAIALCLIANPAAAEPKKNFRDGKPAGVDAEIHFSSSKKGTKPRERGPRIVIKQMVVHPPIVSRQSQSGRTSDQLQLNNRR